jgi:hypothetical protein
MRIVNEVECFVHMGIISADKAVEFVGDRMSRIIVEFAGVILFS